MRGSSTPSGRECPEEFLIFRLPCDLLWNPHRSMAKDRRDVKQAQCCRSQMVQLREELFQFDPGVSIVTWGLDELLVNCAGRRSLSCNQGRSCGTETLVLYRMCP